MHGSTDQAQIAGSRGNEDAGWTDSEGKVTKKNREDEAGRGRGRATHDFHALAVKR